MDWKFSLITSLQSSKRTTKDKKTGSGSVGLKAKSTVNYSAPRRSDRKGTKVAIS